MKDYAFDITWIPLTQKDDQFIGLSHCPGKCSEVSESSCQLNADLRSLKLQKIDVIISLISEIELDQLGLINFKQTLENFGFMHLVEPIDDFSVPKTDRVKNVREIIKKIVSLVEIDKSVLVHCNKGLGRSGLIVALVIKFMDAISDPVSHLRKFRFGAVETSEQLRFIAEFDFFNYK